MDAIRQRIGSQEATEEETSRGASPGGELPRLSTLPDDQATREAVLEAYRSYYQEKVREYEHRAETLEWQLFSTKITFFLVIFLVLTGTAFSAIQFRIALGNLQQGDAEPETTEIELSEQGITVRSSILGVVLLVISLAFFYLYLVHVYPIEIL